MLYKINNIIFNNYYYKTTSDFDQVFEHCSDIKTEEESSYDYDCSSDDELDNEVLKMSCLTQTNKLYHFIYDTCSHNYTS